MWLRIAVLCWRDDAHDIGLRAVVVPGNQRRVRFPVRRQLFTTCPCNGVRINPIRRSNTESRILYSIHDLRILLHGNRYWPDNNIDNRHREGQVDWIPDNRRYRSGLFDAAREPSRAGYLEET